MRQKHAFERGSVQVSSNYRGDQPAVWNFFFGCAGFTGEMVPSDTAILATEGMGIVGGALLRNGKVLCFYADSFDVRRKIEAEIKA